MKNLLLLSVLVLSACGTATAPLPTCPSGDLLGSDNQCYSCTYGTPEYVGSEFGYCGQVSAGGVACCSTTFYNFDGLSCYTNKPWLCSNLECYAVNQGACLYLP
jgi:hypothetical protein